MPRNTPTPKKRDAARSLLIVDDDEAVCNVWRRTFELQHWTVYTAGNGESALADYASIGPDVVLLDLSLPGIDGLETLRQLRVIDPEAVVLMVSGSVNVETAVAAMSSGAESVLVKPVAREHLEAAAERAWEKVRLRKQNRAFARHQVSQTEFDTLGESPVIEELKHQLHLLAKGNAPILLTGETGSGKGWAAQLIHAASDRATAPFISLNCAGLSATFLDSELFGHEKGAFTDAKTRKLGLFEVANGGTLMLDEIGDLAADLQPKLLTVLETQRFRRLGGTHEVQVDVRLIAATHVDLAAAVRAGRFREDLFYRLAVLPVRIPSLRERGPAEVKRLASRLLGDLRGQLGRGPERISAAALDAISRYAWPGNVRELRNVLERALILSEGAEELQLASLPADVRDTPGASLEATPSDLTLATMEQAHIDRVLHLVGGNRSKAAELLGISRQTLYNRRPGT